MLPCTRSSFLTSYSKRVPAISQREIISFPAFITPAELILFTDRLDGSDTPGISHTEIKKKARGWFSLWRGMNLSTYLSNYCAYGLESITFPPWLFTLCHFSILLLASLYQAPSSPSLFRVSFPHSVIPLSDLAPLPPRLLPSLPPTLDGPPLYLFPPLCLQSSSHFPKSLPIPPCLRASPL